MNVTTNGFCSVVRMIKELAPKWVALGGGGYDVANVARAWTLAWAIMNGTEAPEEIPAAFLERYAGAGFPDNKLRDAPFELDAGTKATLREDVERVVGYIGKHLL